LVTQDRSRFFLVFHHSAAGSANLYCHDVQSNQTCPGYPRTTQMGSGSSKAGLLGGALIDNNDKIYFNAWDNSKYGISCWDAMSDSDCGYIELGSHSRGTDVNFPPIEIIAANDKIYAVDELGTLHCVNKDLSLCGGVYPKLLGGNFSANHVYARGVLKYDESYNNLYFLANQETSIACWDLNSNSLCVGWNEPVNVFGLTTSFWGNLFFAYDTNAEIEAVCATIKGLFHAKCVNVDDPSQVYSWSEVPLHSSFHPLGGSVNFINDENQAITIFQVIDDHIRSYNWSTGEKITYPALGSRLYAPFIDNAGCIWFGGHFLNPALAQRLDSNVHPLPTTTADGCKAASASGVIEPVNNYCSTGSAVVTNWDSIVVNNITASD
ncbi:hypothetical protein, partial [Vibrio sagamiensis]|uniref:hypothetical protein n=2 Tax=Vibrio sagamiensis TaxID=512650 RepID=UPI0005870870